MTDLELKHCFSCCSEIEHDRCSRLCSCVGSSPAACIGELCSHRRRTDSPYSSRRTACTRAQPSPYSSNCGSAQQHGSEARRLTTRFERSPRPPILYKRGVKAIHSHAVVVGGR